MTHNYPKDRKSRDDSYSTYVKYYKELTKNTPGMFRPMYDEEEFKERYDILKKAFPSGTARMIAQCQRMMPYFVQRYFGLTEVSSVEEAVSYIQRYIEETGDLR